MQVKLNGKQLIALKGIMGYAGHCADVLQTLMKNHGLDEIEGSHISISVGKTFCNLGYGTPDRESGVIHLGRFWEEKEYGAFGKNSPEYEFLFAPEELRRRMQEVSSREKPLPPDGLWLGSYDDPPVRENSRGDLR